MLSLQSSTLSLQLLSLGLQILTPVIQVIEMWLSLGSIGLPQFDLLEQSPVVILSLSENILQFGIVGLQISGFLFSLLQGWDIIVEESGESLALCL